MVITSADKKKVIKFANVQLLSPKKLKGHMACVPEKRACVPGVAHPCPMLFDHTDWKSKKRSSRPQMSYFTENIDVVKSKKMIHTSSDVLFSTESISEEEKKGLYSS